MDHEFSFAFHRFVRNESGAVTVDWVVLTAAILGMGMLVLTPIAYSSENSAQKTREFIERVPVGFDNYSN